MPMNRLLIANRGEIAVRIMHAAAELGHPHRRGVLRGRRAARCTCGAPTRRTPLRGVGAAAYLDVEQIVAAAAAQRLRRASTRATAS